MPGGTQTRQAQGVGDPVDGLEGEGALHGEQRREQDRDPEEPGGGVPQHDAIGVEGEGEQEQDQHREGGDLVQGHPGPDLDAEVLARHQQGITPHRGPLAPRPGRPGPCPPGQGDRGVAGLGRLAGSRRAADLAHGAPDHLHLAVGDRCGPVQLVRREQHRRTCGGGVGDEAVDQVPPGLVQPGVGLVEEPELGPTGQEDGERGAAPLPCGQAADLDGAQPVAQAHAGQGGLHVGGAAAGGPGPEPHVGLDRQLVVEPGGVGQQADPRPDPAAVGPEVAPQHAGVAVHHRHQSRAAAQQGGLARAVRTLQEHHLAGVDGEVGAGEGGEATDEGDGAAEVDHGLHERGAGYRSLPGDRGPAGRGRVPSPRT